MLLRHGKVNEVHADGDAGVSHGGWLHRLHRQPAADRLEPDEHCLDGFFRIGLDEYAAMMVPVNLASVLTSLAVLMVYFRRCIPATYDVIQLKPTSTAIKDRITFRGGCVVLVLIGFFGLEPLRVPVSAVAAVRAVLLLAVAARGSVIRS